MQSAAGKVFAITELSEQILTDVSKADLFRFVRINRAFRDTIFGSSRLKREMNLLHNPSQNLETLARTVRSSISNRRPNNNDTWIYAHHWRVIPGEVAPVRYVLKSGDGNFQTRTDFRPFTFEGMLINQDAGVLRLDFDLDVSDWVLKQRSRIGIGGKDWSYSFKGLPHASWAGMTLFSMATPVSVQVRVTLDDRRALDLNSPSFEWDHSSLFHDSGNIQEIQTVLEPEKATVGELLSLLEDVLFEAQCARGVV